MANASPTSMNGRIETLERVVAVAVSEIGGIKGDVAGFSDKLDKLIGNRPGFKDVWAPAGLAIMIISTIVGLGASGPLARLSNTEHTVDRLSLVSASQGADQSSSRAERMALDARIQRLEAIIDQRASSRYNANMPVEPATVAQ